MGSVLVEGPLCVVGYHIRVITHVVEIPGVLVGIIYLYRPVSQKRAPPGGLSRTSGKL